MILTTQAELDITLDIRYISLVVYVLQLIPLIESETLGGDLRTCVLVSPLGDSEAARVWDSLLSAVLLMPHPAGCSPAFQHLF